MVTTFGGDSAKGRTNNLLLQHDVNLKGLRDMNAYCTKARPVSVALYEMPSQSQSQQQSQSSSTANNTPNLTPSSSSSNLKNDIAAAKRVSINTTSSTATASSAAAALSNLKQATHPLVKTLHDTILSSSLSLKNVDLLIEVERLTLLMGGCRVTFCKSGKDRTGMACTLEQSRQLGERYGCGLSLPRLLRDANLMRVHGCRLLIAEKNIGRKVYSINKLQAQFLPVMFRPPNQVCEDLMKKDNS